MARVAALASRPPSPSRAAPAQRVRVEENKPERRVPSRASTPAAVVRMWEPPAWATAPVRDTVKLEVRRGEQVLETHDLSKRKSFVLGRQAGAVEIHVKDDAVSRQHAALVHRGEALYVIDLKSAAGLTVDGQRVKPNEATALKEGSRFMLGAAPLSYVVRGLSAPRPAPGASAVGAAAAPGAWAPPAWAVVPPRPVTFHLEEGGKRVQTLDLSRHASYVLGRSKEHAKIVVPHESVSRQHAAFVNGQPPAGVLPAGAAGLPVCVVDLGSAKGTYIDLGAGWTLLKPHTPTLVPPGARVRLGDCPTRVVRPMDAPAAPPVPPAPPVVAGAAAALPAANGDAASIGPTARPTAAAADEDDGTPRFSSLLSSTIVKLSAGGGGGDSEAGGGDGETGGDGAGDGGDGGESGAKPLKNADFRAALLPFLAKSSSTPSADASEHDKGAAAKKRRARGDESDDDAEPAPPLSLDKSAAAPGGLGLILRKTKAAPEKKRKGGDKIKF